MVKKQFSDQGAEALAVLHVKDDDTIERVHDYIEEQVTFCRSDKVDSSTENMDILNSLPRFLSMAAVRFICWLDKHGLGPLLHDRHRSLLHLLRGVQYGSIRLKSGYHHLTNWGTCSLFCIIGEKKLSPSSRATHRGDAGDCPAGPDH